MSTYRSTPDDVLLRMARVSDNAVREWTQRLQDAEAKVLRCQHVLTSHIRERDEQFAALDDRDIAAPEPES